MERYLALKTIVETGTFTAAAEKLGYTQPALSQNIAALEAELGLVLLNRSRGGAGLSADGEEIYPYVLKLLNAGESLRHKAQEMQGLDNSVIRVGAFTSISIYWLPQLMKGFMELYPNVEFKISTGDDRVNEELIKNGEIDFGFVTETPSMDLPHRIICENSLDVVLPVGHPLAGKKTVKIEDLKDEPFINNESGPSSEPLEMFFAKIAQLVAQGNGQDAGEDENEGLFPAESPDEEDYDGKVERNPEIAARKRLPQRVAQT